MSRNNMLALCALLVALICAAGVVGCASQNKLVGTWAPSMGGQPSASGPTWQFLSDGKLIETAGGGFQAVTGTYTVSGDVLSITTPAKGGSATATMAIEWVSDTQFHVTMGGGKLTFTRQK